MTSSTTPHKLHGFMAKPEFRAAKPSKTYKPNGDREVWRRRKRIVRANGEPPLDRPLVRAACA